ncbi:hypothetical protein DL98DRAFT_518992 [Cadophora sp. DSE1049]|nr:hypothetical protein DL98DRAFT_518992 [Cadophora sp. DSE1049]
MHLPQEILTRIAFHCTTSTRANLLTASHATQAAVEEVAWDSTFQLKSSTIPKFLSLYQGHRIRLLRKIVFTFDFPELRPPGYVEYMVYPDTDDEDEGPYEPIPCRETASELKAKDEIFTDQISQLFNALKILKERELDAGNQSVERTLSIITPAQNIHGHICEHRRFSSWNLHLLTPDSLPQLSSIRTLIIGEDASFWTYMFESQSACERPIDPCVVFQLVGKMPCLETLDVRYLYEGLQYPYEAEVNRHHSRVWEGPRRDGRVDAAEVMGRLGGGARGALKNMVVRFGSVDAWLSLDQGIAMPDLCSPFTYDPLSAALRIYSQNLVTLEIQGVVDQTLFWPVQEDGGSIPFWPRLKSLKVTFHSGTPSGRWYFQGLQGQGMNSRGFKIEEKHYPPMEPHDGDEEWDDESGRYENSSPNMFRTKPIDEEVERLLGAFAKALDVMPVLESAELFTFLHFESGDEDNVKLLGQEGGRVPKMEISPWDIVCRWGVRYVAGGSNARLEWQVGRWRPSRDLEKLFCRVVPEKQWVYL